MTHPLETDPNYCYRAPDGGGHHWRPKRISSYRGEPVFELRCLYCEVVKEEFHV